MTKIRILEIIGDSTLAGAPRHLLSLLENFDYKKFSLFVIAPPGPLAGEIRGLKKNIDLETVSMNSKLDLGAIRKIKSQIKKIKPDIIHVHGTRAGSLGRLAAIGFKVPVIYTEHLWTKNYKLPSRLAHRIQLIGLWFLDMFTTLNIAVSQAVKDFMVDNQISRDEKVIVIFNAISPSKKQAKIFEGKEVVIGSVGTLNLQKGMQYLIAAMPQVLKEFPKVRLEIVGEGPFRKNLEKQIKKMKLGGAIHLTGFIKDIEEKLADFDLYVQPSLSESFGLAIIQAMSLGLPVIATNAGGIPEIVTTGKTGILVEPAKPKALADAILKLLRDPKKAKELAKLAAQDVKIKFNLEDMVKETEKVYETLAQSRS